MKAVEDAHCDAFDGVEEIVRVGGRGVGDSPRVSGVELDLVYTLADDNRYSVTDGPADPQLKINNDPSKS